MIELARLDDANGDTYVVEQFNDGSTWIDLYENEWERPIRVTDALKLIDESGLNTTANDLMAKLEETTADAAFWKKKHEEDNAGLVFQIGRNLEFAQQVAFRFGMTEPSPTIKCIQIIESAAQSLAGELAAAQQTIASLRQWDTARPAVDAAEVWDEGWTHGTNGYSQSNPYR